jgi:hypothetical protein
VKFQNYAASIILASGLTLLAILTSNQPFQYALAQGIIMENAFDIAKASGENITGGNMTGAEESIPTANTTGDPTQVPIGAPIPMMQQLLPPPIPAGFNATGGNTTGGNVTGAEEGIPTANATGEERTAIKSTQ